MLTTCRVAFVLACILISNMSMGADRSGKKLFPLRVHLDWITNVEAVGLLLALKHGWYRDAGLDVVPLFKDLLIIDNVLQGYADIGWHSAAEVIKYRSKGAPIKAFAAQYQLNPHVIIVRSDSDIYSVGDLKGKKFGYIAP